MPGLGSLLAADELESSLADYWQMKKEDLQARASGKKNIIDFSPQLLFIPPPSLFSVLVFVFQAVRFLPRNIFGVAFELKKECL